MNITREDLIGLIDRVSRITAGPDADLIGAEDEEAIGARLLLIDACMALFDALEAKDAEIKRLSARQGPALEAAILSLRKKD